MNRIHREAGADPKSLAEETLARVGDVGPRLDLRGTAPEQAE